MERKVVTDTSKNRRIIMVGHSLGGLLIKSVSETSEMREDLNQLIHSLRRSTKLTISWWLDAPPPTSAWARFTETRLACSFSGYPTEVCIILPIVHSIALAYIASLRQSAHQFGIHGGRHGPNGVCSAEQITVGNPETGFPFTRPNRRKLFKDCYAHGNRLCRRRIAYA